MVATEVVLVTSDMDGEKDVEVVTVESAEVVAGVIEIAEECLTSTALISPTPLVHLPTKNGPRSFQTVGKPMSLSSA